VDWSALGGPDDNINFVAQLMELRRRFPQLRPRRWVEGRRRDGSFGMLWLTPQATEMTEQDWNFPEGRFLSYVLAPPQEKAEALFVVLNGALQPIPFFLPDVGGYGRWTTLLDTASKHHPGKQSPAGLQLQAWPRSVLAFSGAA
jgi:glycogen operon protein